MFYVIHKVRDKYYVGDTQHETVEAAEIEALEINPMFQPRVATCVRFVCPRTGALINTEEKRLTYSDGFDDGYLTALREVLSQDWSVEEIEAIIEEQENERWAE